MAQSGKGVMTKALMIGSRHKHFKGGKAKAVSWIGYQRMAEITMDIMLAGRKIECLASDLLLCA